MWRPRGDRERFIGSYDPEHEMPDPDRGRGERWQSDAYRHNSRDTRFAYRWDPDRVEERYEGPRRDFDRDRYPGDARDRERAMNRGGYGGGYAGSNYSAGGGYSGGGYGNYGSGGNYGTGPHWDRSGFDRGYDAYRGNDRDRGDYSRGFAGGYGGPDRGPDIDRDRGYDRGRDYGRGPYSGSSWASGSSGSYGDELGGRGYRGFDDDDRGSWGGYGRDNDRDNAREGGSWSGYGRGERDRWRR
jgi:hypothetical protein